MRGAIFPARNIPSSRTGISEGIIRPVKVSASLRPFVVVARETSDEAPGLNWLSLEAISQEARGSWNLRPHQVIIDDACVTSIVMPLVITTAVRKCRERHIWPLAHGERHFVNIARLFFSSEYAFRILFRLSEVLLQDGVRPAYPALNLSFPGAKHIPGAISPHRAQLRDH